MKESDRIAALEARISAHDTELAQLKATMLTVGEATIKNNDETQKLIALCEKSLRQSADAVGALRSLFGTNLGPPEGGLYE